MSEQEAKDAESNLVRQVLKYMASERTAHSRARHEATERLAEARCGPDVRKTELGYVTTTLVSELGCLTCGFQLIALRPVTRFTYCPGCGLEVTKYVG